MYNFKYDIKVNEENGRPYIHLDQDYASEPEHRFMAMELAAYSLNDLVVRYTAKQSEGEINQRLIDELIIASNIVGDLADQLAIMLKEQEDTFNDMKDILGDYKQKNNEEDNDNDEK